MDLFATRDQVARLEQALQDAGPAERTGYLVQLAWHLRQRDTQRSETLALEAQALAADARDNSAAAPRRLGRILVTLAECALLGMRVDEARALAARAGESFAQAGDACGRGDVAMVLARVAEAQGDRGNEVGQYRQALIAYGEAGDAERLGHARAAELIATSMGDAARMDAELAALRADGAALTPALAAHLRFVEGIAAFQRGEFLAAAAALGDAARETEAQGLVDHAFRAEAGLVAAYSNLGDREASCTLAEHALGRARQLRWPRAIGHSLANFARQLHTAGQHHRAVELLDEARQVLAAHPRTRVFAIASYYFGDACLALGRNHEALQHLELAEGLMRDLGAHPEVACLKAISAQALSRLGRSREALERAQAALDLARSINSRLWQVEALRALAEVHSTHAQEVPGGDVRLALDYLRQALAVVDEIGGHHEKSEIFTELARAHEAAGDHASALAAERAGRAEELREQNRRAINQLMLARERHETDRQRVEADLQRSLVLVQSERAAALEDALRTLEDLRLVGQDVTSHLDPSQMLRSMESHLVRLADVSLIGVFVFDAQGARLTRHYIERGKVLPMKDVALEDFESYGARSARERKEVFVEAEEGGRPATRVPGTEVTRSLWFGPLLRGDELLGVLTVQSTRVRAYGEREKLIFRTLAGYAAVAFANARTHGELEDKHRRLITTEAEMRLLATTDPLTALDNRRRFFAAAESELARAIRYGGAVGLLMADLDRFKALNDSGGHGAGDRVMQAVAQALRSQQRPHDVVARMGGEEFALVLPGADIVAALSAAERLRGAVEDLEVEYAGRAYRVTISVGCTAWVDGTVTEKTAAQALEGLLREADAALYEAKRLGRNRCVAATPPKAASALG